MEGVSGQTVHLTVATIPDGDCHRITKHVELDVEVPTAIVLPERDQRSAVDGKIIYKIITCD